MLSLRVNEILEEKNLTPYWLGKQTGISQNNILKICNGETSTIRFDTIEKICTTLDCSISDLFTSDDPKMKRLLAYAEIKINKKRYSIIVSLLMSNKQDLKVNLLANESRNLFPFRPIYFLPTSTHFFISL